METLINPNQIAGRKIVNIYQTGVLTRYGSVVTSFSDSNYFSTSARLDERILCIDNVNQKSIKPMLDADNWEMNVKIKFSSLTKTAQGIISPVTDMCFIHLETYNYNKLSLLLSTTSGSYNHTEQPIDYTVQTDTWYWIKFSFDSEKYVLKISTDGTNYTTLVEISDTNKPTYSEIRYARSYPSGRSLDGEIDLQETNIKVDGELFWQGIETF
jgi:hypothetical protein